MAATAKSAAAAAAASRMRVIVVPVSSCPDEAVRLLDWYAANLRSPGDRLVLVRLLVPDWPLLDEAADWEAGLAIKAGASSRQQQQQQQQKQTRYRGGGSASLSSAVSTSCESATGGGNSSNGSGNYSSSRWMEEQMDRQLEASVDQEAALVRRLRERGLRSFRFIHAFCKQFTDCLLSIASEQGADLVLAPLSAFAADHDLARTYHLYRKARLGVVHVPDDY